MINRLFIAFAAILTSFVLAYAHLSSYWKYLRGKVDPIPEGVNQFHSLERILPSHLLLWFGIGFFIPGVLASIFAFRQNHKAVFFCFVGCMFLIWIRLWAGTI